MPQSLYMYPMVYYFFFLGGGGVGLYVQMNSVIYYKNKFSFIQQIKHNLDTTLYSNQVMQTDSTVTILCPIMAK